MDSPIRPITGARPYLPIPGLPNPAPNPHPIFGPLPDINSRGFPSLLPLRRPSAPLAASGLSDPGQQRQQSVLKEIEDHLARLRKGTPSGWDMKVQEFAAS
jgi:hypothetical protein